jgi:hypothetical protein
MRLAYACEAESPIDRCWRQQRKIEARLAEEGTRPPGMHNSTFDNLCAKWDELEERKDALFWPRILELAVGCGMNLEDLVHGAESEPSLACG